MLRTLLLGALASLLWAAPAAAFTPPELYVRLTHANSSDHTPASDWMPLSSAPRLNWIGGYEIGYAFQDTDGTDDPQRAALQITGVPDGQPTQPLNEPYCIGGPGRVGTIVPVGTAIQFEGTGPYTVKVSVGPPSGGPNDCMTGSGTASSTGSFTVDAPVPATLAGSPMSFRLKPLPKLEFVGVQAVAPPGGEVETRCARDATVNPDGSITGALVTPPAEQDEEYVYEANFKRPGAWTCVARGFAEGMDENLDNFRFGTPWSAPVPFDVRSDFRRAKGEISKPSSKTPSLRFTAEFPEAAGGGKGKFVLRRFARCKGTTHVFKTAGTFEGSFDTSGRATVKVRRPPVGFYTGTLSFSGTRFYTKSADPNLALMAVSKKGRLSYTTPGGFPQC